MYHRLMKAGMKNVNEEVALAETQQLLTELSRMKAQTASISIALDVKSKMLARYEAKAKLSNETNPDSRQFLTNLKSQVHDIERQLEFNLEAMPMYETELKKRFDSYGSTPDVSESDVCMEPEDQTESL